METGDDTPDELRAALWRVWLVTAVASLAVTSMLLLAAFASSASPGPGLGEIWSGLSEAGAL